MSLIPRWPNYCGTVCCRLSSAGALNPARAWKADKESGTKADMAYTRTSLTNLYHLPEATDVERAAY